MRQTVKIQVRVHSLKDPELFEALINSPSGGRAELFRKYAREGLLGRTQSAQPPIYSQQSEGPATGSVADGGQEHKKKDTASPRKHRNESAAAARNLKKSLTF